MQPHMKLLAGALLALTFSRSEVPAQGPDSVANPKARVPPQLTAPPAPPVPPSSIENEGAVRLGSLMVPPMPPIPPTPSPHVRGVTSNPLQSADKPLQLNAAERDQMTKTLEKYRVLSPAQRSLVLRMFKRFEELPP